MSITAIGCFSDSGSSEESASSGKESVGAPTSETVQVWLDKYDEKTVTLENSEFSDYEWTSKDETVVKVVNGKLVAQGEGQTQVVATKGNHTVTIEVTVADSGAKPRIELEDVVVYEGIETVLTPSIQYNGETLDATLEYVLSVEDDTVASVDGLKVTVRIIKTYN